MNEDIRLSVKKRMMFISGEDFYFLTYNLLLLLHEYDCYSEADSFKDFKKVAFLVEFVSDERLVGVLERHQDSPASLNPADKQILFTAFARGGPRSNLLIRLSHALERKGLVKVFVDEKTKVAGIYLVRGANFGSLFSDPIFANERKNISRLKEIYSRVRSVGSKTLIEKLYSQYGVSTWGA